MEKELYLTAADLAARPEEHRILWAPVLEVRRDEHQRLHTVLTAEWDALIVAELKEHTFCVRRFGVEYDAKDVFELSYEVLGRRHRTDDGTDIIGWVSQDYLLSRAERDAQRAARFAQILLERAETCTEVAQAYREDGGWGRQ